MAEAEHLVGHKNAVTVRLNALAEQELKSTTSSNEN
jgi:hypothetical protein